MRTPRDSLYVYKKKMENQEARKEEMPAMPPTFSLQSSSSSSYTTSTNNNGQQTGQSYQQTSQTTHQGTTTRTTTQNLGERPVTHTQHFDSQGHELVGEGSSGGANRRIEDVRNHPQLAEGHCYNGRV
jgi:hypothetical protein